MIYSTVTLWAIDLAGDLIVKEAIGNARVD